MTDPAIPAGVLDPDGTEELLQAAVTEGGSQLLALTRTAVRDLLSRGVQALGVTRLFHPEALYQLTELIASVRGTAELYGRATIRDYQRQLHEEHGEPLPGLPQLTTESLLDEAALPLMRPEAAVRYFTSLVPTLNVNETEFGIRQRRTAFTLAVAADTKILTDVQAIIRERLETGRDFRGAPADIDEVLDAAGVSKPSEVYSTMLFRTSMMDSYAVGSMDEMQDPEIASEFPWWKYSNPDDSRSRPHHAALNGKYFTNAVRFEEVRDEHAGQFDGYSCRCVPIPVWKGDVEDLRAKGIRPVR